MSSESSLPAAGTPCWINISVQDIPRARKFYSNVFNWSFIDVEGKSDDIIYFRTPDPKIGLMGGLVKAGNVAHTRLDTRNNGNSILYLVVDSLDDAVKKIVANGGKKGSEPTPEGNGLLQHFEDTEGNYLGMYMKT